MRYPSISSDSVSLVTSIFCPDQFKRLSLAPQIFSIHLHVLLAAPSAVSFHYRVLLMLLHNSDIPPEVPALAFYIPLINFVQEPVNPPVRPVTVAS